MSKWMQNVGEKISLQSWGKLWGKDIKFTPCQELRERCPTTGILLQKILKRLIGNVKQ